MSSEHAVVFGGQWRGHHEKWCWVGQSKGYEGVNMDLCIAGEGVGGRYAWKHILVVLLMSDLKERVGSRMRFWTNREDMTVWPEVLSEGKEGFGFDGCNFWFIANEFENVAVHPSYKITEAIFVCVITYFEFNQKCWVHLINCHL